MLFLLAMLVAPLVTLVPYEAATPALVLVGFLMMTQVKGIDWDDFEIAIPAFLTIILMPFTYSISAGIGAGFVSYVLLKLVRGKAGQVHPLLWVVAALFVVYFAIDPLEQLLGVSSPGSGTVPRARGGTGARSLTGPGRPKCQPWPWSTPSESRVWRRPRFRCLRRRPRRGSRDRTRPTSSRGFAAPGRR